jgi:hypothetical protein
MSDSFASCSHRVVLRAIHLDKGRRMT